jgi:carboxylesterase type B
MHVFVANLNFNQQLFTDGGGYFGMFDVLSSRFHNSSCGNTYIYLYSHKGAASHTEVFGRKKFYGTCHMDDLFSLFPFYERKHFYTSIPTDFDRALHRIMPHLWANFARTG